MNPAAAAAGLPLSVGDLHVRLIDFGSAVDKHSIEHLYSTEGPSDDEQTAEYAPPEALLARSVSSNLHVVLQSQSVCLSVCLSVCVCALPHGPAILVFATKPKVPIAHPEASLFALSHFACLIAHATWILNAHILQVVLTPDAACLMVHSLSSDIE